MVPSLKVPVAVNCCDLPKGMLELDGATVRVTMVALVTVRLPAPTTPPNAAVIVELPGDTPRARPWVPAESLMVAIDGAEDVQVAEFVRFCVLPSANVAVAVYCNSTCSGMLVVAGITAIDCNIEDSTTMLEVLEMAPSVAVIMADPADCPVACPEPMIVTTCVLEELHVTVLLMVWVDPSLYVPMA